MTHCPRIQDVSNCVFIWSKKDITLCQQTTFKYYEASFHTTFIAVSKILIMFNN